MEEVTRNFRRTYYKSLGVNETGGSLVGELEEYLKSEIIGRNILLVNCHKHHSYRCRAAEAVLPQGFITSILPTTHMETNIE